MVSTQTTAMNPLECPLLLLYSILFCVLGIHQLLSFRRAILGSVSVNLRLVLPQTWINRAAQVGYS